MRNLLSDERAETIVANFSVLMQVLELKLPILSNKLIIPKQLLAEIYIKIHAIPFVHKEIDRF